MINELERPAVLQTAFMACISVCAAVGLWSLLADFAPLTGAIAVPTVWFAFTALLVASSKTELQRSYEAGIANSQIDQVSRLPSAAVGRRLLEVEFAAAERGRPLSIVCFAIDDYAALAATFGPGEAKRLLIGMGTMLRRRTREMNLSFRYDDQGTFFSVLGGIPLDGAQNFVGKVYKDVAALRIQDRHVTVSASVCSYDGTVHSADEMLAKAQRRLATARRKGAGQILVDGEDGLAANEGYAVIVR